MNQYIVIAIDAKEIKCYGLFRKIDAANTRANELVVCGIEAKVMPIEKDMPVSIVLLELEEN